ncbi:MAG: ATP-binding protein [Burkholderiales bacterium]|nr:ATP-binding protein [Burkholderiales bacterium]
MSANTDTHPTTDNHNNNSELAALREQVRQLQAEVLRLGQAPQPAGSKPDAPAARPLDLLPADPDNLLSRFIDHMAQGLLVIDAQEGRIRVFNQAFCRICNFDPEFMATRPLLSELVRLQMARGDFGPGMGYLDPKIKPFVSAATLPHPSDPLDWAEILAPAVYVRKTTAGRYIQVQSYMAEAGFQVRTFSDVSDFELARQEAQTAVAAKGRLLASVSHELRTPLTAIIGLNQFLLRGALNPEQQNLSRRVEGAAQWLLSLIDNLLAWGRSESGKMQIRAEAFVLRSLLEDISSVLSTGPGVYRVPLVFDAGPELPDSLIGDGLWLKQVLMNLAHNGLKFTARGEVRISVRVLRSTPEQVWLRFEVKDSGIGITPDQQTRIFEPFQQVKQPSGAQYAGTGLGLTISRDLLALMGGQLQLDSAAGQGSCFYFELAFGLPKQVGAGAAPAPDARAPVPAVTRLEPAQAHGQLAGLRVLAVDDNANNLLVLQLLLEPQGCLVTVLDNAPAAIEQLRQSPTSFDVLLLDMLMQGMDGPTAALQIRQEPGLAHLPMVCMTANLFDEDRARCLDAGMNAIIGKPFQTPEIIAILSPYLRPAASGPAASGA